MRALEQASTERLLSFVLETAGGEIERNTWVAACRNVDSRAEITLESDDAGFRETLRSPWVLAGAGAHGVIRRQLEIDFEGTSFATEWHSADVPLRAALARKWAHVFSLPDGAFLFMIQPRSRMPAVAAVKAN